MLTGMTPFDAPTRNEIMVRTAQVEETATPVTQLVPQAPPVLDLLFARALAKDPMHRYPSAIELGEAFRKTLELEDSAGWEAQQRLAENAASISQIGAPPKCGPERGPSHPRDPSRKAQNRRDAGIRRRRAPGGPVEAKISVVDSFVGRMR